MGGNFHRHRPRAVLLEPRQGGLQRQRIGGGVAAAFQRAVETGAQGADDAATLAEPVERLGQQLADAGLAVGAGHADQVQATAGLAIEAPGNRRQLHGQPLDGDQRHVAGRQISSAFGFIGNGRGATGDGVGDVRTAILAPAGNGQEQVARLDRAAVQGEFANQQAAFRLRQQLVQAHRHQPRPPLPGAASACCCGVAGRLSGGMFISRSVPDITLLNTGAETRPPK
ncbi:hypothetical protein D3C76_1193800 [compost metagenome]